MRGINLVGMEGPYSGSGVAGSHGAAQLGPRAGTDYPVHSPALIDYYRSKNVRVIRLLFSWERLQSRLWGPVPAVGTGYAAYAANLAAVVEYATDSASP